MDDEGKVNVNHASAEELTRVPGVGPVLAGRLLEARPFDGAEDLRRVSGIGEASLRRIRPALAFNESDNEMPEEAPRLREGSTESEPPQDELAGSRPPEGPERRTESEPAQGRRPDRRWVTRSQAWWGIATASVISILLSVALTLSIMLAINGTLDVQRHQAVRGLQTEISSLQSDLTDVDSQLTGLSNRMQALEGLTGRVTTIEDEVGSMQSQMQQAISQVGEMRTSMDQLSTSVADLAQRTDRVDRFLEGLRNLVNGLDAGNGASDG